MNKRDYAIIGCSLQSSIEVKEALYEMIVVILILFPQNVSLKTGRSFQSFPSRVPASCECSCGDVIAEADLVLLRED